MQKITLACIGFLMMVAACSAPPRAAEPLAIAPLATATPVTSRVPATTRTAATESRAATPTAVVTRTATRTPTRTATRAPTRTARPTRTAPPTEITATPTETPPVVTPTIAAPIEGGLVIVAVNKREEYVDIRNSSSAAIDLAGWRLRSERGAQDCTLAGVIAPEESLRVWAMTGTEGFACGYGSPIWNNSENDDAILLDPQGQEVARYDS